LSSETLARGASRLQDILKHEQAFYGHDALALRNSGFIVQPKGSWRGLGITYGYRNCE